MTTYTDSPFDKALASAIPTHSAAHDGTLPDLAEGQHCYLLASDGLYVMGRGRDFHALIRVATLKTETPFGDLVEGVHFHGDLVPRALVEDAADKAIATNPDEWAGAIVRQNGIYSLQDVGVDSSSPSHVTYDRESYDDSDVVVDMHSHGDDKAYFSPTDNDSDAEGIHLSTVFGYCSDRQALQLVARVTINGHFLSLALDQWLAA